MYWSIAGVLEYLVLENMYTGLECTEVQLYGGTVYWSTAIRWYSVLEYSCTVVQCTGVQLYGGTVYWSTAVRWYSVLEYIYTVVQCATSWQCRGREYSI